MEKIEKKELLKFTSNKVKEVAKKEKFRVVSNCIYKTVEEYFIFAVYWIEINKNSSKIYLRMNIKEYNYDNIFWNIFHMYNNISSKDSLRAIGAFSCPSFQWAEKEYILDINNAEECMQRVFQDFNDEINEIIKKITIYGDFSAFILLQDNILGDPILKCIAYISQENYFNAENLAYNKIKEGESSGYINEGKDLYEFIVKYCKKS